MPKLVTKIVPKNFLFRVRFLVKV